MLVICWAIWYNRNKARLGGAVQSPSQVFLDFLRTDLDQYLVSQDRRTRSHRSLSSAGLPCWYAPPGGSVKINFDGAMFNSIKEVGIGVVARDWRGNFIGGLCKLVRSSWSVDCVKALAAFHAMELGVELGLTSIIFEGDSKVVVEDIMREESNLSSHGVFIE